MRKIMTSFGVGAYRGLLSITAPPMMVYAERHGYEHSLLADVEQLDPMIRALGWSTPGPRGWHWWKVPWMASMIAQHDADVVLWLDCDALIVDGSVDVLSELPDWAIQSLIFYRDHDGVGPGTGCWLIRREMLPWLRRLWEQSRAGGTEDDNLQQLLGRPAGITHWTYPEHGDQAATELMARTHKMDHTWGHIPKDLDPSPAPRIYHAYAMPLVERHTYLCSFLPK